MIEMDFLSNYYGMEKPKRKAKGKSKTKSKPRPRQRDSNIYDVLGKTMETTVALSIYKDFSSRIKL